MQYAKIVNRTGRDLRGTWDGRTYELKAKTAYQYPMAVCQAIKRQNPIMGSEDPYTMTMDYLVGIEEEGDPLTELTDLEAFPNEIEKWNRKKLVGAPETTVVTGKNGLFAHERNAQIAVDGQASSAFVKP